MPPTVPAHTRKMLERAYFDLMSVVSTDESAFMGEFYKSHTDVALTAIKEISHVLMAAKSIQESPGDVNFLAECLEFSALASLHPEVVSMFRIISNADQRIPGDPLICREMVAITRERLEGVSKCLN